MDNEFEALKSKLLDTVVINTTAKNGHVGEIERLIRTIKGKCRAIKSEMAEIGITHLPYAIIKALITFVVMWHNAIPSKQGASQEYSPRELVLRWQLYHMRYIKARFGSYCEEFEDNDITNTQKDRTIWGICLGPTSNMQGTYKFFDLNTGHVVKRRTFKVIPTPDQDVDLVKNWGRKSQQESTLAFRNRKNEPFDWEDKDESNLMLDNAVEQPVAAYPGIATEMPGVQLEREKPTTAVESAFSPNV